MKDQERENIYQAETLSALFRYATEGIVISDEDGRIIRANPSSERLFRYNEGELEGKSIEDLVPPSSRQNHKRLRAGFMSCPHARAMGRGISLHGYRKDNTEFPVEISLSSYQNDGKTFVIAFIVDITERRRQEDAVLALNQQLERMVEERTKVLQEALCEIEKSKDQLTRALQYEKDLNDMKSRFVTMASHEFRTPLSTILSSISLVQKYNENARKENISRHVQRIKSAVTNMNLILNDFLSAERLEEGKVFVREEKLRVAEIAEEVINEMHGLLKPGQKVDYCHSGKGIVMADRQMVRNIFLNLLSNAIKFSGEDKIVTFRTGVSAGKFTITVADKGIGIPAEEQDHVFERFFRARNVTNIQGTGLGLNIVSKYLECMNGSIEFSSEPGKGTTFYITIPQSKDENHSDN